MAPEFRDSLERLPRVRRGRTGRAGDVPQRCERAITRAVYNPALPSHHFGESRHPNACLLRRRRIIDADLERLTKIFPDGGRAKHR